jgi:hypothetical protein
MSVILEYSNKTNALHNDGFFYHISQKRVDNYFQPRIPCTRAKEENGTIERICVSTSIPHCLGAIPDAGSLCGFVDDSAIFGIPFLLYVYKVGIDTFTTEQMITAEELVHKNYVPDAHITNEHWLLTDVYFSKPQLLQIKEIETQAISVPNFGNTIVVNKIHYEFSIEDYEREYIYTFISKEDLNKFKILISNFGAIVEEKLLDSGYYYSLQFKIPPNVDIAYLWEQYCDLRCNYSFFLDNLDFEILRDQQLK